MAVHAAHQPAPVPAYAEVPTLRPDQLAQPQQPVRYDWDELLQLSVEFDHDERIIRYSRGFAECFGPDDLAGRRLSDVLLGSDPKITGATVDWVAEIIRSADDVCGLVDVPREPSVDGVPRPSGRHSSELEPEHGVTRLNARSNPASMRDDAAPRRGLASRTSQQFVAIASPRRDRFVAVLIPDQPIETPPATKPANAMLDTLVADVKDRSRPPLRVQQGLLSDLLESVRTVGSQTQSWMQVLSWYQSLSGFLEQARDRLAALHPALVETVHHASAAVQRADNHDWYEELQNTAPRVEQSRARQPRSTVSRLASGARHLSLWLTVGRDLEATVRSTHTQLSEALTDLCEASFRMSLAHTYLYSTGWLSVSAIDVGATADEIVLLSDVADSAVGSVPGAIPRAQRLADRTMMISVTTKYLIEQLVGAADLLQVWLIEVEEFPALANWLPSARNTESLLRSAALAVSEVYARASKSHLRLEDHETKELLADVEWIAAELRDIFETP